MIAKSRLKFLKSLQIKKFRQENQAFLVEGEKILQEVLQADFKIQELYCTEKFFEEYQKLIKKQSIDYQLVNENELSQAGSLLTNSAGLAVLAMKPNQVLIPQENEYVLALDGIQDPGNLGTIIRIADWYGINKIICSEDTVEVYNPKVIGASMASFLRVNLYYSDLKKYLYTYNTFPIYGAVLEGQNIHNQLLTQSGILIMGNESKGIRPNILPFVQHKLTIPRFGEAESLNVGVATAVILDNFKRIQNSKD